MKRYLSASLSLLLVMGTASTVTAQQHEAGHGRVDFTVSCTPEAQESFATGLALLHHMMYEQAEASFREAAAADASCAMAHWGVAMTVIHPLWGERPSDEAHRKGVAALTEARRLGAPTPREQAYLSALGGFYTDWESTPYPQQLVAFEAGFQALHEAYPADVDAAAFFALAHLATAQKGDATLAHQRRAGKLLEGLLAHAPEHPGLFHYTIHAYDNPALADRAVDVARGYDKLAPAVPHALHMPSHIFVRLGLWKDVAAWNLRSAEAALRHPVGGHTSMHYPHAQDYLVYAYLQEGRFGDARKAIEETMAVERPQVSLATAYAQAAVPARYALERRAWKAAAALPARPTEGFPWDDFPAALSITEFARGLGAARSGDLAAARASVDALDALHTRLNEMKEPYWAVLARAQHETVAAWLTLAEGDRDKALARMTAAADLEDSVDKHPVTPGAVLPARELLGEMLLALARPAEALAAYEAALARGAGRTGSLHGAALAAEAVGQREKAAEYFALVLANLAEADEETPAFRDARRFGKEGGGR